MVIYVEAFISWYVTFAYGNLIGFGSTTSMGFCICIATFSDSHIIICGSSASSAELFWGANGGSCAAEAWMFVLNRCSDARWTSCAQHSWAYLRGWQLPGQQLWPRLLAKLANLSKSNTARTVTLICSGSDINNICCMYMYVYIYAYIYICIYT